MATSEVPEAARAVSHMVCSETMWELCFHTALGRSLLINLKWKHLLVSRISNYLALPHQQWQWAALKPECGQSKPMLVAGSNHAPTSS